MMKKLAAALLAAAMTVSISAPAFAADKPKHPFVKDVAEQIGWEYSEVGDNNYDVLLSGDLDLGTVEVAALNLLTNDGLGYGNQIDDDVVKPGKT